MDTSTGVQARVIPHATPAQSGFSDTHKWPEDSVEYERLDVQHEMLKTALNGKLIQAPIDLSDPELKILDSATADARWLQDVSLQLPSTVTLVGTDILPEHFPSSAERPSNVTLRVQSIFEPWPEEYQEQFDLVHQRFVLSTCSEAHGKAAIKDLYACVKPGGYIQVQEGDMTAITEGDKYTAMGRFRDLMKRAWTELDKNLNPAVQLSGWLDEFGAAVVKNIVVTNKAGPMAENKVQGERAIQVLMHLLAAVEDIGSQIDGFFFTRDDFSRLRNDLFNELKEHGNTWNYRIVVAQKPRD